MQKKGVEGWRYARSCAKSIEPMRIKGPEAEEHLAFVSVIIAVW